MTVQYSKYVDRIRIKSNQPSNAWLKAWQLLGLLLNLIIDGVRIDLMFFLLQKLNFTSEHFLLGDVIF